MLADLRIENLAVVQATRASFTRGLNVISGETGAGKSILLQALSLATGGRGSSELIRHDADYALVEARFELNGRTLTNVNNLLSALDLAPSDGELIVRRRLARDGKSRVYINDASVTAGALQQVTMGLVEQTGQHEQIGLLRSRRHLDLLDGFARAHDERALVAEAVAHLRKTEQKRDAMLESKGSSAERAEFLRFYLQEFESLDPEPGEEARLREGADRLLNAERIRDGLNQSLSALYEGEGSAYDQMGEVQGQLRTLAGLDPELVDLADVVDNLQAELEDVARSLRTHAHRCVRDDDELEQIQARLHRIRRLCRKHGATLDQIIEKMDEARDELRDLEELDLRLEEVDRELSGARDAALELAAGLSRRRGSAAPALIAATESHLKDLMLDHCRFSIDVDTHVQPEALTATGADRVTFLFSANPGDSPRPLAKVASGGELSRMLLALKCALVEVDDVPVKVFDEIDAGLGGASAEMVGRKVRGLADSTQVLCVTHLPQIASFADNHVVVSKTVEVDATKTVLLALSENEREEEVARMLGGTEITETTREHAREMLGRARVAG